MNKASDSQSIFSRADFVRNHLKYRRPPQSALQAYLSLIAASKGPGCRMLDIGAGTGHFSIPVAEMFPTWEIVALEPSVRMARCIAARANRLTVKNLRVENTTIERFVDSNQFNVILLSEVVHLFEDIVGLVERLSSMLIKGGLIAFRTSTHRQLAERQWYTYFPSARLLDMQRHPSLDYLEAALRQKSMFTVRMEIDESRPIRSQRFIEMFKSKVYSTLNLISTAEFSRGLRNIERDALQRDFMGFDYKMTLLLAFKLGAES